MSQENVELVRGVRTKLPPLSEKVRQGRTLDERFFVRFPAAYRLVADRWARLPLRSRLRRLVLARLAGRTLAAVNRRDFDVLFLAIDPGIEYRPAADVRPPGMDAVRHGHDGYREVWRQMIDSFEDFHAEPEELLDLGDQLLATIQYRGHGTGSGVPVNIPTFQLFRLRRGLVIWQQDFSDRSEALEAAGLKE
jgi:ketosteroid isomerase-like protein